MIEQLFCQKISWSRTLHNQCGLPLSQAHVSSPCKNSYNTQYFSYMKILPEVLLQNITFVTHSSSKQNSQGIRLWYGLSQFPFKYLCSFASFELHTKNKTGWRNAALYSFEQESCKSGILAYAIKLNFRFLFLLAFMRVISWNDAPWFSSVSQSLSETNQTVFFLRTDQTKCIFDPSPGLCIFQGLLDCQEIQYVGSYHNIHFLWKFIAGTYTEQNYKCTTFIFASIFHELNSKI